MRGVRKAIAIAMCRPSCGCRGSSEEVVAILSRAGDLGEDKSDPACQKHRPMMGCGVQKDACDMWKRGA
eukprot:4600954-Pyramimonas_sp.AAC.1